MANLSPAIPSLKVVERWKLIGGVTGFRGYNTAREFIRDIG
ncbi:MAG: hypothetical protein VCB63_06220 [Alphaproteobacteria bacterium]